MDENRKTMNARSLSLRRKSPFPLIFPGSCSRGLLRKTVGRGLEGTCCMTTRVRRDLPNPAWFPLLQCLSVTMPFSPTPGQGSSPPHSLVSFYRPDHTNGCPAAPRAPRSAARDLPLCAYHQARFRIENPAAEDLPLVLRSHWRVTLNLFG